MENWNTFAACGIPCLLQSLFPVTALGCQPLPRLRHLYKKMPSDVCGQLFLCLLVNHAVIIYRIVNLTNMDLLNSFMEILKERACAFTVHVRESWKSWWPRHWNKQSSKCQRFFPRWTDFWRTITWGVIQCLDSVSEEKYVCVLWLEHVLASDTEFELYTGFQISSTFKAFFIICNLLVILWCMLAQITVTFLQHHKTSTGEQDHLVRLRCGLLEVDIAHIFGISQSQVSRIWTKFPASPAKFVPVMR